MLAHDIPPPSSVGSQQRRTHATPNDEHLNNLIASRLVGPDAREGKKRRNVEFSASTDNLGEFIISSPLPSSRFV